jgi:hypothetical protein
MVVPFRKVARLAANPESDVNTGDRPLIIR